MPEKLDKKKILRLLVEADIKWFTDHSKGFEYREHLEFTTEYIVKNYNKEAKKIST